VGSCLNTSSGVFTANKVGKYFVSFSGFLDTTSGGGALYIRKDGAQGERRVYGGSDSTFYVPISISGIIDCNVGTTIDIYQTTLKLHGNESSLLSIFYIGL
jgi:hypothetical protein